MPVLGPETAGDEIALLDALFARAPVAMGFLDEDLRYRWLNAALAELNGVPAADHVGRTPVAVLGAAGAVVEELLRRVLETGEAVTGVEITGAAAARPDDERQFLLSVYPLPGRGVAGIALETTAERDAVSRAQTALRAEQAASALVDAVFAAAPVGLVAYDADARFRRVNPAVEHLDGRRADELLGRRPGEVLDELGEQIEAAVREVLASGRPVLERRLTGRLPGFADVQHREASYFPVLGPDGAVLGAGGVVRDVGPEHAAEAERIRLLREALSTRAQAEAQEVRAQLARADAEAALERVGFLARATTRLTRSLDPEEVVREAARIAVPALADWCYVTLLEPGGRLETAAVVHPDPQREALAWDMARRYPPRLEAPAGPGYATRTGETQLIPEVSDELLTAMAQDEAHLGMLRALGFRSGLVVPLRAPGRVVGAVTLISSESDRRLGPDDVRLVEALAARAALALVNARVYTERAQIAHTLQRALLPAALPHVPGLDLAVRYRAAGAANEVGGDFYDVFPSADGMWTAVVGDVAGKGADAAALTSLSRHTLRAAALRGGAPIEHLALLNDALLAHEAPAGPAGGFCTVVVAQVRPGPGGAALTLATGGHLPPYVVRADGAVEPVALRGSLVGALPDPRFAERRLSLGAGDKLVLYTDGAVELRGPDPRAGERELPALLREHGRAPGAELAGRIERHAAERQGGEPRDDIAVLVIEAAPGS